MLVLRPVEQNDLPQLQRLARESLIGVTSLPDDSEHLREKIAGSRNRSTACAIAISPAPRGS
jgi:arginine N-succinyltransferase